MRKFILSAAATALLVIGLSAQNTVTRSLSSFDHISISGGFDQVILKEGSAESVSLEVSGIDADKIITEVKHNTLEIGMKKGSYHNFKAKITITFKSLQGINNSGSSDVETVSTIKGDSFEFHSSGSGRFKGAFDVKKLEIALSGSSDMKLNGTADKQEYAISGSGGIDASNLKGKSADVAISGSGDVDLNVDGPVHTAVSGSGNVKNNK